MEVDTENSSCFISDRQKSSLSQNKWRTQNRGPEVEASLLRLRIFQSIFAIAPNSRDCEMKDWKYANECGGVNGVRWLTSDDWRRTIAASFGTLTD